MAPSDTSKTHMPRQRQKASMAKASRPPSPTLMGITSSQHWTTCQMGSTPYPMTISESLGQDASLAPAPESANASRSMTPGTDPFCLDGSGLPCPPWPLAHACTEINNSNLSLPATLTPLGEGKGDDANHGVSQLTLQKDGLASPLSQLQGWWEQEVVDEPYHGIGFILGNFATTPNSYPVPSSFLGLEGAVWGSVCQRDEWLGETWG